MNGIRFRYEHSTWLARLVDDGTMDTVVEVERVRDGAGYNARFDGDYASQYRLKDGSMTRRGLRELGKEAAYMLLEDEELSK